MRVVSFRDLGTALVGRLFTVIVALTAVRQRLLMTTVLFACTVAPLAHADPLLTFPLRIKGHALRVELADTPDTRRVGLMYRSELPGDGGMLFIFDRPSPQAMWMKNTVIALSVAFIGADGRILNVEDMQPMTETAHPSAGNALYAIETNLGWFRRHGVKAGDAVEGLEAVRRTR